MATNSFLGFSEDGSQLFEMKSKMARQVGDDASDSVKSTIRETLGVPASAEGLTPANNLSDVASAATSRTNLDVMAIGDVNDSSNSKAPSNGLYFDGTSYVLTGTMGGSELNDSVTLHIGVKFGVAGSSTISIAKLVNTLASAGAAGVCNFIQTSGGALNLSTHDGTAYNAINNAISSIDYDRVYLVSLVSDYAGSGNLIAYVDGEQVGTVAIANQPSVLSTPKLQLGSSSTNNHTGQEIYLATLYNRAQSAAEIAEFAKHLRVLPPDQWGGANLIASPNALDSEFSASNATVATNTGETTDPDGGNAADKITASAGSAAHYLNISSAKTLIAGRHYRWSLDVKQGTTNGATHAIIGEGAGSAFSKITFRFSDNTITDANNVVSSGVQSLGSGWYRIWFIAVSENTTGDFDISIDDGDTSVSSSPSFNAAGTENFYGYNAQLEPVGAVVALLPTPGSIESDGTWLDSSSNTLNGTPTGVTPLITEPQISGTWTPGLTFGGGSTGMAITGTVGNWRRVGKLCHFSCRFVVNNKGTSEGGTNLTGLPFTSKNNGSSYYATEVMQVGASGMSSLNSACYARINQNATTAILFHLASDGSGDAELQHSNFTNGAVLRISGTYEIE